MSNLYAFTPCALHPRGQQSVFWYILFLHRPWDAFYRIGNTNKKNSATHYKRFCNFLSKNNSNSGLYSGQLWECFRFWLLNSEVRSGRKLVIDWQNTCVKIAEFTELLDDFWSDLQKVIRNHHRRQQNWCYYEAVRPKKPLPVKALQMAH